MFRVLDKMVVFQIRFQCTKQEFDLKLSNVYEIKPNHVSCTRFFSHHLVNRITELFSTLEPRLELMAIIVARDYTIFFIYLYIIGHKMLCKIDNQKNFKWSTYKYIKFPGHGVVFVVIRLPNKLFFNRSKVLSLAIFQIEGGIDPVSWLPLRFLKTIKQEKHCKQLPLK
jgi:hypothetical protein